MTDRRKILALLESRATYGYSKNVMREMVTRSNLDLHTIVTGMHLMPELGNSINLIREDGFPVSVTVPLAPENESKAAWPRAMGHAMAGFAEAIEKISPDILILFGDRAETFACTVAASYMSVPTAHVQAGDKSGHVDDIARMAMGKLVNIHFPSCEDSAERLRRMGEQEFRIFQVGAPQLDNIVGHDFSASRVTTEQGALDLDRPYILLVQHSVLVERQDVSKQIKATAEAALKTDLPIYWIFPNSDPGYQDIISQTELFAGDRIKILRNIVRDDFLRLLANCAVLVGNSSSGILEAPSFRVPVVNIGNRQRGRPQAGNILNCGYDAGEIYQTIQTAMNDGEFRAACARAINPYGDGKSSERICDVLSEIALDQSLIDKETIY